MNEKWKKIKGFKHYKISNFGRVHSSFFNRILIDGSDRVGYRLIHLSKNGRGFTFKVHRLVAEYFIENPNNFSWVNHKDGNKENNHVSNLEWISCSDNAKHAFRLGLRNNAGENHSRHKLKKSDIEFIRNSGISNVELARQYNMRPDYIYKIKSGKRWFCVNS